MTLWFSLLIIGLLLGALLFSITKKYLSSVLILKYRATVTSLRSPNSRSLYKIKSKEYIKPIFRPFNKEAASVFIWNPKLAASVFKTIPDSALMPVSENLLKFINQFKETNNFDITLHMLELIPLMFTAQDNSYFYSFNLEKADQSRIEPALTSFFNDVREFTIICGLGIDKFMDLQTRGMQESIFIRVVSKNNDIIVVEIDMELK